MLILTIAHILLTIGIIAGFGYYVRRRTRALYKYEMLSRLAGRMRYHANKIQNNYPERVGEPGHYARLRAEKIEARVEELNEVAKWVESV